MSTELVALEFLFTENFINNNIVNISSNTSTISNFIYNYINKQKLRDKIFSIYPQIYNLWLLSGQNIYLMEYKD